MQNRPEFSRTQKIKCAFCILIQDTSLLTFKDFIVYQQHLKSEHGLVMKPISE